MFRFPSYLRFLKIKNDSIKPPTIKTKGFFISASAQIVINPPLTNNNPPPITGITKVKAAPPVANINTIPVIISNIPKDIPTPPNVPKHFLILLVYYFTF